MYRRLQREGIPFATGILWENDLDYPAAKALASAIVSVPPFGTVREETVCLAKKWIDACRKVVCAIDTKDWGELGPTLGELLEYAQKQKKL